MRSGQPRELIGIDLGARRLDVPALPDGVAAGFAHDPAGIGRPLTRLGSRAIALVVAEATGGLRYVHCEWC